jgi:anti-sigma factor RsiW
MTCKEFIDVLGRYLAGDLDPGAKNEGDLHLKVCPDCVNYLRSYELTIRLGKSAFSEDPEGGPPEDLVDVVLSRRARSR